MPRRLISSICIRQQAGQYALRHISNPGLIPLFGLCFLTNITPLCTPHHQSLIIVCSFEEPRPPTNIFNHTAAGRLTPGNPPALPKQCSLLTDSSTPNSTFPLINRPIDQLECSLGLSFDQFRQYCLTGHPWLPSHNLILVLVIDDQPLHGFTSPQNAFHHVNQLPLSFLGPLLTSCS